MRQLPTLEYLDLNSGLPTTAHHPHRARRQQLATNIICTAAAFTRSSEEGVNVTRTEQLTSFELPFEPICLRRLLLLLLLDLFARVTGAALS